jgi:predicted lipid-binding transport protein (Tim44 family)
MGPGAPSSGADISLTGADQEAFERLLIELQDAFGHEDYGRLRTITTPEIMSYLAEELSDNATHGRRNEVSGTRLLDAEVSEAWRDDDGSDYATIAMRYESIDVMRDRNSGAILTGDPGRPTQATELWTFIRPSGSWSTWKVSAIQEA